MKGASSIGLFILLFIGMMAISVYLSSQGYFTILLEWIGSLGLLGNFILFLCLIATSFPIPMGSTPLALSAGFLYGVFVGFLTTSLGAIIGAALAFFLCRKWMKSCVQEKLNKQVAIAVLLAAVNKHAFKICFMMRMTPIPLGVQNASLAISNIEFNVYIFSTTLGLLPELLMLVYFGSTAKEFSDLLNGKVQYGYLQQIVMVTQALVCILILGFILYTGRQAFRQVMKDGDNTLF